MQIPLPVPKMKYIQVLYDYKIGYGQEVIPGLTRKAIIEMAAHKLKDAIIEGLTEMDIDRFITYCKIRDYEDKLNLPSEGMSRFQLPELKMGFTVP